MYPKRRTYLTYMPKFVTSTTPKASLVAMVNSLIPSESQLSILHAIIRGSRSLLSRAAYLWIRGKGVLGSSITGDGLLRRKKLCHG